MVAGGSGLRGGGGEDPTPPLPGEREVVEEGVAVAVVVDAVVEAGSHEAADGPDREGEGGLPRPDGGSRSVDGGGRSFGMEDSSAAAGSGRRSRGKQGSRRFPRRRQHRPRWLPPTRAAERRGVPPEGRTAPRATDKDEVGACSSRAHGSKAPLVLTAGPGGYDRADVWGEERAVTESPARRDAPRKRVATRRTPRMAAKTRSCRGKGGQTATTQWSSRHGRGREDELQRGDDGECLNGSGGDFREQCPVSCRFSAT